MPAHGQRIDGPTLFATTGILLFITLLLAVARLYIKINKFRRMHADDVVYAVSVVLLIGSTSCLYALYEPIQIGVKASIGIGPPPANLADVVAKTAKLQASFAFLCAGCIYFIKLAFLLFFRLLLEKTTKLKTYWWIVSIFTLLCGLETVCTNFIVCPTFDSADRAVCLSKSNLPRVYAAFFTSIGLDILTDLLVISIPIILLWSTNLSVRRKIGLGSLLVLSIFCVVISIIRAIGHKLPNGQNDAVWALFWLEIQACVSVNANAMTAFRSLFHTATPRDEPPAVHHVPQSPQGLPKKRSNGTRSPGPLSIGMESLLAKDLYDDGATNDTETTLTSGESAWGKFAAETEVHTEATNREWYETKGSLRTPSHVITAKEIDPEIGHPDAVFPER